MFSLFLKLFVFFVLFVSLDLLLFTVAYANRLFKKNFCEGLVFIAGLFSLVLLEIHKHFRKKRHHFKMQYLTAVFLPLS